MNMNSFDPSTMTWAAQMAHPQMSDGMDPFQDMSVPVELHDHQSTYSYAYAGSEDMHNLQNLATQATPSMKRYSSMYEDPFSDAVSTFDVSVNQPDQADPDTPSIDRNHKLLSFSTPTFDFSLLDYNFRPYTIAIMAQLHGMFFLAESPWSAAGEAQAQPSGLLCYRRNLFQVVGEITMPRSLRYIMTETGEQMPIMSQELVIQATESTEGNAVKIISVPWKTPVNPGGVPGAEEKLEKEPTSIPLDLSSTQDTESDFAVFPFSWKRLQFRIATANNGRRKELQQHFVLRLKIMATLATGGRVCICEVHSHPIMVRGRSPRNFQSRKDMPLNGNAGHARKPARTSSGDGAKRPNLEAPTSAPVKAETAVLDVPAQLNLPNDPWTSYQQESGSVPPRTSPLPALNQRANVSPEVPRSTAKRPSAVPTMPPAPISLKLVEEETPKDSKMSQTPPEQRSAKRLHIPPRPPSFTLNTINSPDESADLLYEYFPLSLSDWSEPVDAVYRPHVVHHIRTKAPTDDPVAGRNIRSKRMYVE